MLVHELSGEFVSPKTKVAIVKEELADVPGAYVLKNVRTEFRSKQPLQDRFQSTPTFGAQFPLPYHHLTLYPPL